MSPSRIGNGKRTIPRVQTTVYFERSDEDTSANLVTRPKSNQTDAGQVVWPMVQTGVTWFKGEQVTVR